MSKRYEPMKDYGRSTKKPKLEIVVNKGQNVKNFQTLQRHAGTLPQLKIAPQGSSDGLWDDDDDDVILLASQVVENIVANESTEITFSDFAPGLQYATSTQKLTNASLKNCVGKSWENDDEVFPNPNSMQKTEIFKVPTATSSIAYATETKKTTLTLINPQKSNENSASAPSQSRKEKAFEGKIQFLEKSLNKIKEENTKLTTDLEETKTKMISKEGEVTVLRDEIRHLKKQIQDIRVEKIHITEEAKTQCKSKIAELSKEVEAKKTALELKSIECNKMKMRHADETMRLEMSIRENCNEIRAHHPAVSDVKRFSIQQLRSLQRLANLSLNDPIPTPHETSKTTIIPKEIFEQSKERGTSKIRKTLFQIELENLQIIAAQYRSSGGAKNHNSLIDSSTDVLDKTLASVRKVFPEFWTYVHSLEFSKSLQNHRHKRHRLELTSDDKSDSMRNNLFQPTELYEQEKAVNLRRYVALLSILCYTVPELPIVLLSERHEEYFLIQIITDAIGKLSFSRECDQHFGLLEAFSAFLHSLITHTIHSEKYYDQSIGMLKTLVFCQPSAWVFLEISRCFLTLAEISEQACSRLCVNSPTEQQFAINQNRECEISSNSCLLQVYCTLLEWSFPLYKELLSIKQFELLTSICGNYVRFVSCLLTYPVKFVQDMIPYDDQNDEVGEEIENTCECYVKMCKTTVTLLCTVLYYWQKANTTPELTKQIEQISKIGVKLMFRIFCQNSTTRILRSGEDTTHHYFDLICKWWSKYANELHFSNYDNVFLQKLLTSPFVAVKLAMLGSRTICKSDLEQWYICSTDDSRSATNEPTNVDGKSAAKNLRILDDAADPKKFFDRLLQKKTCNFE